MPFVLDLLVRAAALAVPLLLLVLARRARPLRPPLACAFERAVVRVARPALALAARLLDVAPPSRLALCAVDVLLAYARFLAELARWFLREPPGGDDA